MIRQNYAQQDRHITFSKVTSLAGLALMGVIVVLFVAFLMSGLVMP